LGVIGACGLVNGERSWRQWWGWVRRNLRRLIVFWIALAGGLGVVALRNWWVGGIFNLYNPAKLSMQHSQGLADALACIWTILEGDPAQIFPRAVLWLGSIGAVVGSAVGLRGKGYPVGLGIVVLGALGPYLFFRFWAYPPRFSLHLLPWAVLGLCAWGHISWSRARRLWRDG